MKSRNLRGGSTTALRRVAMAAPMLDAETERELLEAYQRRGSSEALGRLLASHFRLVLAIARKFSRQGVAMEDLVGEGNLGLIQAAIRYELERDTRFATYAAWWIRAYVRRYTLQNRRIVGLPSTRAARRILAGLRKTERRLVQIRGGPVAEQDIAVALGVSIEDLVSMVSALGGRDVPVGPLPDGSGYEAVAQDPSPEERAATAESAARMKHVVRAVLSSLDARERMIVESRLLSSDGPTLAALGSSLGLSRERVRQLEMRARATLRNALVDLVA